LAPRILTLANQKGGVGKTTTAINLATALAAIGERVLIVDLDPQGNASTGLGINRTDRALSAYDVLVGEATVVEASIMTTVPNVAIVPSTMDLLGVELTIAGQGDRAFKLRNAFKQVDEMRINDKPISYIRLR
jgi:chromosome partitioning protein